jgi:maltooligosyltrehalose trehalohydrolase
VSFLQNHDQVGNRAMGERLSVLVPPAALRAATVVLLLAPALPLIFMGQEWAAPEPFLFFSDLGPDLGPAVSEGRRREFARFPEFADPAAQARIPDPQSPETYARSVLDWSRREAPPHDEWLALHRRLLAVRRREIAPLLSEEAPPVTRARAVGDTGVDVEWRFLGNRTLRLVANLGAAPVPHRGPDPTWGRRLHASGLAGDRWEALPPWCAACYLAGEPSR